MKIICYIADKGFFYVTSSYFNSANIEMLKGTVARLPNIHLKTKL